MFGVTPTGLNKTAFVRATRAVAMLKRSHCWHRWREPNDWPVRRRGVPWGLT